MTNDVTSVNQNLSIRYFEYVFMLMLFVKNLFLCGVKSSSVIVEDDER